MVQLVVGLIVVCVVLWLVVKLAKFLWSVFLIIAGLIGLWVLGPFVLIGVSLAFIFKKARIETLGALVIAFFGLALPFWVASTYGNHHFDLFNFTAGKFLLTAPLFLLFIPLLNKIDQAEQLSVKIDFYQYQKELCQNFHYISLALLVASAYNWNPVFATYSLFGYSSLVREFNDWFSIGFWLLALILQLAIAGITVGIESGVKLADDLVSVIKNDSKSKLLREHSNKQTMLSEEDAERVFNAVLAKYVIEGKISELGLKGGQYLFDRRVFDHGVSLIKDDVENHLRLCKDDLAGIVQKRLFLPSAAANDYAEFHTDFGEYYNFRDGKYFCSYSKTPYINSCCSCGTTELASSSGKNDEWYCSEICKDTDKICLELNAQKFSEFTSNAISTGVVLMGGADAWSENHKIFATGGQGHGFGAEKANHMADKIKGKNAEIIGNDNAKNGADRLVDGDLIQTKYCSTAARSVGAAFDGQKGNYRYYNNSGKPMALEVPKDQYEQAIKTMQQKISEGKVPGVTDPDEAKKLVIKGSVTYDQARNITQFGTVESLTFDLLEGAVVGTMAGGISFCITAATFYYQTGDKTKAIKSAMLQASKTFTKTTIVFVGAQQLHRLAGVQNVLANIDVSNLSDSVKTTLQNGLGVDNVAGVNKALRGTVVTTAVLIAVTTGPDLIKLVRGRISTTQFLKNLAVVTTSAVGGVIGSIAGGALLSPFGPVGVIVGRIGGGMIGGGLSGVIAKYIGDQLAEDDQVEMLEVVVTQIEYLARVFLLTEREIENLSKNLNRIISQELLEELYANQEDRIAIANMAIKPIVVGIIKQRPQFEIIDCELDETIAAIAA